MDMFVSTQQSPSRATGWHLAVLLLLTFVASCLVGGRASATDFPPVGYEGDRKGTILCPDGQYVVGLTGGLGEWMDRLGLICAPLLADGSFGERKKRAQRGGPGGWPAEIACDENTVAFFVDIDISDSDRTVWGLHFRCQVTGGGDGGFNKQFFEADDLTHPPEWSEYAQHCPKGEAAQGFRIHYGQYVNALGLICEKLVVPAGLPPVTVPDLEHTPTLGFIGSWDITSSSGRTYVMVLDVSNGRVTGTFTNDDPAFNGEIYGTMDGNGREFTYTFSRPDGAQGSGLFELSKDKMSIKGTGGSNGEKFTWGGSRMQ